MDDLLSMIDEEVCIRKDQGEIDAKIARKEARTAEYIDKYNKLKLKAMSEDEKTKYFKDIRKAKRKNKRKGYQKNKRAAAKLASLEYSIANEYPNNQPSTQVILDLGFSDVMNQREWKSLAFQMLFTYNLIRKAKGLINLTVTEATEEFMTFMSSYNVESWTVNFTSKNLDEILSNKTENSKEYIYLSPDAHETLESFSNDKIYIVGGIVDKTVRSNLSYHKSLQVGIKSAKLPMDKIEGLNSNRRSLNVNKIFEIIDKNLKGLELKEAVKESLSKKYFKKK